MDSRNAFVFSYIYYLNKPDDRYQGSTNDTWKYSTLTLNGFDKDRQDASKNTALINQDDGGNGFWTIKNVKINANGNQVTAGHACLYNGANTLMATPSAQRDSVSKQISQAICQKDQCDAGAANSANITVEFTDSNNNLVVIKLKPEDYSYAQDNKLAISNDNLDNWVNSKTPQCSAAHSIGLGRLFFYRSQLVFRANKDQTGKINFDIRINELLPVDKITDAERWVLFGFGLAMVLTIVGAIVYKVQQKPDASLYREANNA